MVDVQGRRAGAARNQKMRMPLSTRRKALQRVGIAVDGRTGVLSERWKA